MGDELAPLGPCVQQAPSISPVSEETAFSEQASTSEDAEGSKASSNNGYIYHKVSKLDTLAGLAIRYHVTVSDIKRANGILSDNAMFAREHIKIPTGSLPMSEEAQVLLARLMSGYGRDASLNARERKAPGTVSITQLPGSPSASRSSPFGSEAVDDDPGTPYSRRSDKSSSEPGDVELMERSIGGDGAAANGYGSDRVRRRTKNDSNNGGSVGRHAPSHLGTQQQLTQVAEAAVGWLSNAAAAAQAALPAAANGLTSSCLSPAVRHSFNNAAFGEAGGSSSGSTWDQFTHAISAGGNSLVEKIKRAASQPALGASSSYGAAAGFGDVADVVLRGAPPPRSPGLRGVVGSTSINSSSSSSRRDDLGSIDLLSRGITQGVLLPPRPKDTKGD